MCSERLRFQNYERRDCVFEEVRKITNKNKMENQIILTPPPPEPPVQTVTEHRFMVMNMIQKSIFEFYEIQRFYVNC